MNYQVFIIILLALLIENVRSEENIKLEDLNAENGTHTGKEVVNKEVSFQKQPTTEYSFLNVILNKNMTLQKVSFNETTEEQLKHVICMKNLGNDTVEIIDRAELLKLLLPYGNSTLPDQPGRCLILFFFATTCPFSAQAAPHFNALPRAFPDMKMVAIDASLYHSFNTQYGVIGIPTLVLFHQGRPVAKFNNTEYTIFNFAKFIVKYTKIKPKDWHYVTSADFAGPLPSVPEKKTDHVLVLAWCFIMACVFYHFSKSVCFKSIVEMIKSNWRESEAQHEHNE